MAGLPSLSTGTFGCEGPSCTLVARQERRTGGHELCFRVCLCGAGQAAAHWLYGPRSAALIGWRGGAAAACVPLFDGSWCVHPVHTRQGDLSCPPHYMEWERGVI